MKQSPGQNREQKRRLRPLNILIVVIIVICIIAGIYAIAERNHLNKTSTSSSTSSKSSSSKSSSSATPATIAASHLPAVQVSLENATKPLHVDVKLSTQNVIVYDANNKVVKAFICSSGSAGKDTPTGTFKVSNRGESFYNPKYSEGGYNWVRFNGSYLFHSVPFDKNKQLVPEQVAALGEPSSNGCIHLSMDNSKWIYDNIPRGTTVVVEE
ncbi:MAG TPA: L,D-transpeptidase [Ruminococcaceae bacterium]|nr:L,D-transpeptidase [Oscillospiraceae bacterium]